jgi:hypothetical protein
MPTNRLIPQRLNLRKRLLQAVLTEYGQPSGEALTNTFHRHRFRRRNKTDCAFRSSGSASGISNPLDNTSDPQLN